MQASFDVGRSPPPDPFVFPYRSPFYDWVCRVLYGLVHSACVVSFIYTFRSHVVNKYTHIELPQNNETSCCKAFRVGIGFANTRGSLGGSDIIKGRIQMSVPYRWQGFSSGLKMLFTVAVLMGFAVPNAQACGGFFCNNQQPTLQAGERILFAVDDDNIRAYVQVFYDGEADDFAWIIPVASKPDVGVGTDEVFNMLENLTRPRFELETKMDETCWQYDVYVDGPALAAGGIDDGGVNESADPVAVLEQAEAGPYNYAIVESDNSQALIAWLDENGYSQPPEAHALIDHYVANEMKFVAVKLLKDKDAGDVAPIILDFQEENPCVPLVLTQVAATPDMPVKAYLLGDTRAVPTNWLHVDVNQKKLDWFTISQNWWWGGNPLEQYEDILLEAIKEADGHAFTTEYAGTSEIMKGMLDNGQYDNVTDLLEIENPTEFVMSLQNYFSGSNQLLNILQKHIPVPEGMDTNSFYNWPEEYQAEYDALDIDLEALYAELIEVIVTPVKEAQEMFDAYPYLTRLYSKVGIDSMDRDPIFQFQDAGDVSNVHTATFHMQCADGAVNYYIELENGETFVPEPQEYWNLPEGSSTPDDVTTLPAASEIRLFAEGVAPRVVSAEFVEYVDDQLDVMDAAQVDVPEAPAQNLPVKPKTDGSNTGTGCNAAGNNAVGASLVLSLLGFALFALRRRESQLG